MPPKKFSQQGTLWKLNKCVYGLVDASRHWFLRVKKELLSLGCKSSTADRCFFYFFKENCLEGLICVHVDDFCVVGSEYIRVEVVNKLANVFLIVEMKSIPCHYLGLGIRRDEGEIIIDLADYVKNKLTEVPIESYRVQRKSILLTDCERNDLRIVLGKLQWLATQSDPTLCITVSLLCGKISTATIADALYTNKIIRRLKMGVKSPFASKIWEPLILGNYCRILMPFWRTLMTAALKEAS